jgi:hypothetical protein
LPGLGTCNSVSAVLQPHHWCPFLLHCTHNPWDLHVLLHNSSKRDDWTIHRQLSTADAQLLYRVKSHEHNCSAGNLSPVDHSAHQPKRVRRIGHLANKRCSLVANLDSEPVQRHVIFRRNCQLCIERHSISNGYNGDLHSQCHRNEWLSVPLDDGYHPSRGTRF